MQPPLSILNDFGCTHYMQSDETFPLTKVQLTDIFAQCYNLYNHIWPSRGHYALPQAFPDMIRAVKRGEYLMRRKIQALFLTLMLILTSAFPALAVQYGDQGEDVREVQRLLFQTGWLFEEPDGIFGPNTERAVMTYQEHYGLTPNGIVDDALLKQMQEDWDGLFYPDGTPRRPGSAWPGPSAGPACPHSRSGAGFRSFRRRPPPD